MLKSASLRARRFYSLFGFEAFSNSSSRTKSGPLAASGSSSLSNGADPTTLPKQNLNLPKKGSKVTPDHFKFQYSFAGYVHHGSIGKPVVSSLMDLTDSTSNISLLPRRRLHGNPYETLSIKNGDDAMILSPNFLGVADGVSGWEKVHADSGLFARSFLENISRNFSELSYKNQDNLDRINNKELSANVDDAFKDTLKIMEMEGFKGSSTLVGGMIIDKSLKMINIGDSKLMVIRNGEIVAITHEQYNKLTPLQVGTQENGKLPSQLVEYYDFKLENEDIVLICSDGVTDNLYPDEILEVINKKLNIEKTNLQEVSNSLLYKTKSTAFDSYCVTPYVEKINEINNNFIMGGKLDDISICISKVVLNN